MISKGYEVDMSILLIITKGKRKGFCESICQQTGKKIAKAPVTLVLSCDAHVVGLIEYVVTLLSSHPGHQVGIGETPIFGDFVLL